MLRPDRIARICSACWLLSLRLCLLIRIRGVRLVLREFLSQTANGGGIRRFILWVRDTAAFERRHQVASYREWTTEQFKSFVPSKMCGLNEGVDVVCVDGTAGIDLCDWDARSKFVLIAHPDAYLSANAVSKLLAAAQNRGVDAVYCDEDRIIADGVESPYFKPDFSIDFYCELNYVGPVYLVRAESVRRISDSRQMSNVVSPYELLLRLYEGGSKIYRLPEVLVHWQRDRDKCLGPRDVVSKNEFLIRYHGSILGGALAFGGKQITANHLVSIVIPTRDRVELLTRCIESIYQSTNATNYEVLILDNGSIDLTTHSWFAQAIAKYPNLAVKSADYPFNWSKLNNLGADLSSGDLLLFLNNDVEVLSDGWLDKLVVQAIRADVGAVGPMLLFPDGTIQHAGVVIGMGGFADHIYAHCSPDPDNGHMFADPNIRRNVLAVTGACLMIEKRKFEQIGGFRTELRVCGDIDLCIRASHHGVLNLYEPNVRLLHLESASRSRADLSVEEVQKTFPILKSYLQSGDPYYNPALCLKLRYPNFAA